MTNNSESTLSPIKNRVRVEKFLLVFTGIYHVTYFLR